MKLKTNEKLQAAVLMLLSCVAFSYMQIFVHFSHGSVTMIEQVFFRNIIGLIIAFIVLRLRHTSLRVETKYGIAVLLRSLFGFIGIFFLFYASSHAGQADVSLLSRTSSIWVFLFQYLLGRKMTKTQVWVVFLCILGAVIAINPRFDSALFPLLCACLAAVCSGGAYTAIGYCKGHVDPFVVILYFCLFSTVCSGVMMIKGFTIPIAQTMSQLIMIGITAAIGQIALTFGLQKATAGVGSVYEYFSIVVSAVLGYIYFGEALKLTTLVGSVLIVAGAVWNYQESKRIGNNTNQ